MKLFALALPLVAMGCATVAQEAPKGRCDATRAQSLIGSSATSDLGAQALKLTGARALRWIQPGTMVTMDFREDRLNIRMDRANIVTGIDCG